MPTFSYVLRPTKKRKDETFNIYLRVIHNRKIAYKATNIFVSSKQFKNGKVVNHVNASTINFTLSSELLRYEKLLLLKDWFKLKNMSINEVMQIFETKKQEDFFVFAQSIIDTYVKNNQIRKSIFYTTTMNALKQFVGKDQLPINSIDYKFLEQFQQYLTYDRINEKTKEPGLSQNSRNTYLNHIKFILNKAVNYKIMSLADYPFREFKLEKTISKHRDITVEELRKIIAFKTSNKQMEIAKDVFLLTFFLIGINIKDLFHLSYGKDFKRISYSRSKTSKAISVKVEPEARILLNKYATTGDKLYFTGTTNKHTNLMNLVNPNLKKIAKKCGIDVELSTYYARHSWATIATKIGIPRDIVGRCLGHTQISITEVYINRDYTEIDNTNRKVLDFVFQKG